MNEYIALWKNYVNFNDRTTRKGYWMAYLINFVVSFVISAIATGIGFPILATIYGLAILIPNIAIAIRRLRDAGKGWAYILVSLIPCVGFIWLIILLAAPSVADDGTAVV